MYELLPLVGGAVGGTLFVRRATRWEGVAGACLALAAAIGAWIASGEVNREPVMILWDLTQAGVAAVLAAILWNRLAATAVSGDRGRAEGR